MGTLNLLANLGEICSEITIFSVKIDKHKYHEIKLSNDKLVFRKNKKTDLLFGGLLSINNFSKMITRLNNKNDFLFTI